MAKANKTQDCIVQARASLHLFTGDELESYIRSVSRRTRELQEAGVPFARKAAIDEISNESIQVLLSDAATSVRNIEKYTDNKAKMDNVNGMRSLLEKTSINTDANIETASKASEQRLSNTSFSTLSKEHLDLLESGDMDNEIAAHADGTASDNHMVKEIAELLPEYIEDRNANLIRSNALSDERIRDDRFFRNTYNQSLLRKIGKENWIPLHKSRINVEETFKNSKGVNPDGTIDEEFVNKAIGNTYDNIIQNNGVLFTNPVVARDLEAIKKKGHMFYIYKDWSNWTLSNKEYGQGSLFQSWMMDVKTSGKKIGMAEIMGSNPEAMYNQLRKIDVERNPDNTTAQSVKRNQNDSLFKYQLGINRPAWSPTLASIGSSMRNVSSMARLPLVALKSIPDVANIAGMASRAGVGHWQPMINAIVNLFDMIPSKERKVLAKFMSGSVRTHMGVIEGYTDLNSMGSMVSKLSNKFFQRIGLEALDRGNKLSAMEPIMRRYGKDSEKTLSQLNGQQQAYLNRFNITETEWDALRAKTQDRLFTTDNVESMTNAEIKDLWSKSDKLTPLTDYKSALYRKVFAMFDTMQEFAVLNPNDYIRMLSTGNMAPGTIPGEIWRGIMQFKSFPVQYMRRIMAGGMQDFDSFQGRVMYGVNMALSTVALTQLADALVSVAKGVSPANPQNMSKGEATKYYIKILAGGMGVFSAALDDKSTTKDFTSLIFATPSIKLAYEPLHGAVSLLSGNVKEAKNAARNFVNNATPLSTFPVMSNYINPLLGNKPYLEPGQHPIF